MITSTRKRRLIRLILLFTFLLIGFSFSPFAPTWENPNHPIHVETRSFEDYETNYVPFELVWNNEVIANTSQIYVIETANDLFYFSQLANGSARELYLSLHYVLGDDIDYLDASRLGRFFRQARHLPCR